MQFSSHKCKFVIAPLLLVALTGVSSAQRTKPAAKKQGIKTATRKKQDSALEQQKKAGLEFIKEQNWQNAAVAFEQILINAPDEPESNYWLALAHFNLKRSEEAAARLDNLIASLDRPVIQNKQLLADALVLSAVISAVKKDNADAIKKLNKAIAKVPGHFDANISLGRAYFGEKNFDRAIEYFRKAKEIRNKDLNARFYLATAQETSGNYRDALAEYRGILAIDPLNPSGNLGLGILLLKSNGDTEAAIKALQNALNVNGNLYEARVEMGKALLKTGRTEESLQHFIKAAELRPENPEPHFQLSIAYRKLGRKAEADEQSAIVKKIHESRRGGANPQ